MGRPVCLRCHEAARWVVYTCDNEAHKLMEWSAHLKKVRDDPKLAPAGSAACQTCRGSLKDVDFDTWTTMVNDLQPLGDPKTECAYMCDEDDADYSE